MVEIFRSRSGFLSAQTEKGLIHSRYNPQGEAESFLQASLAQKRPRTLVIFAAGLGYLPHAARKMFPKAKVLSIYLDSRLYKEAAHLEEYGPAWYPKKGCSLEKFLDENLPEEEILDLEVIEWNASENIDPDLYHKIEISLRNYIRKLSGNILTGRAFGKRWIRNAFINFAVHDTYSKIEVSRAPALIIASGPSLEASIPLIKVLRPKFVLFALPSALRALYNADILPDILVTSDPGFYAGLHFNNIPTYHRPLTAMPLTASRGTWRRMAPPLILWEGSAFDYHLVHKAEVEPIFTPANGTVSGTALELALSLNLSPVFFAGLDFSYSDIKSHCRPFSFESYLSISENRYNPLYSMLFRRSQGSVVDHSKKTRSTRALETYKNWFSTRYYRKKNPMYHLSPPLTSQNIPIASDRVLDELPDLKTPISFKTLSIAGRDERSKVLQATIIEYKSALSSYINTLDINRPAGSVEKGPTKPKEDHALGKELLTRIYGQGKDKLYRALHNGDIDKISELKKEITDQAFCFLDQLKRYAK